jgi:hypothetical protein
VVDFVEDHKRLGGQPAQRGWIHRHLLVGGDHAVHIGGQRAVGGRPGRIQVEL